MTDYTALPNSAVNVGGLPSGTTITALRDNPLAMFEGAVGAPRLLTNAINNLAVTTAKLANLAVTQAKIADYNISNEKLVAPGAGDTYLLRSCLGSTAYIRAIAAYDAWDDPVLNPCFIRAINYGTIRIRLQHYTAGLNTAWARVVRDGSVVAEWSAGGSNVINNQVVDVAINPGQRIVVQHRGSNGAVSSGLLNVNVFSSTLCIGVI